MKNRRLTIVAFLLCACLVVGFGYAQLSTTLRIDGNATINHTGANDEFDGMVYFVDPVAKNTGDTIELDATNDIATIEVKSLTIKGSTAVFTVYVQNDYNYPVYVTPKIDANSNLYKSDLIGLSSDWDGKTHEIEAGKKLIYTLTVTCLDAREDSSDLAIGFDVTDIKPTDASAYVAYTGTPKGDVNP